MDQSWAKTNDCSCLKSLIKYLRNENIGYSSHMVSLRTMERLSWMVIVSRLPPWWRVKRKPAKREPMLLLRSSKVHHRNNRKLVIFLWALSIMHSLSKTKKTSTTCGWKSIRQNYTGSRLWSLWYERFWHCSSWSSKTWCRSFKRKSSGTMNFSALAGMSTSTLSKRSNEWGSRTWKMGSETSVLWTLNRSSPSRSSFRPSRRNK